MFEFDICLCGNGDECPYSKECLRGSKRMGTGIYTISNFYDPNSDECEYFIEKDKKGNE